MIWLPLVLLTLVARCGCQISSSPTDADWPGGSYGLPKAKSGCPGNRKNGWCESWIFQDMEDDSKSTYARSETSPGSHLSVKFSSAKDVNRTFCMKQDVGKQTYWPKGKYCIYKASDAACPGYMNSGWVRWDDEDSGNINKKGGWLPDGTYNSDTVIQYCCQTKGNWDASIELPVSQPFYLLTSSATGSPKCQMVMWALSYLEYIVFDTEDDSNGDAEDGDHVFLQGRKLYYCYYEDCRSTLSVPGGSFRSYKAADSDMDPRSQYCSWLIAIAESYVVSLTFKELNIPSCDDTFLKIFDGSNDTAPLLGTYCGTNASTEIEILSSKNNLFFVSNSGRYARYPKSIFSFHAQYNAEHMTGCHYEVSGDTGYIRSPMFDFPKDYPRHSSCSWLITVDDAHLVAFNFSFLNLRDDDVIEVYDGHDENTSLLVFYSRLNISENNGSFLSSTNDIFIVLKYGRTTSYQTEFALEHRSQPIECSSTLSGPWGSIRFIDPRSQYCSWLITIAESYVVSLKFQELTIPSCDDTFLKIFDGLNDTAPLLGTYCGTNASTEIDILSSTNNLFIMSNSGPYERSPKSIFSFHAQYNAEHITECRHEVLEETGYIRSPKFDAPKDYPRHSNCSWLITVDDVDLVVFNFSFLDVRDDDVIEVYDGHDENTSLLAFYSRLNISKNDGTFLSSANSVFIILKYGLSSSYLTEFALEYDSVTKRIDQGRNPGTEKADNSIKIIIISTSTGSGLLVSIVLAVLLAKYKRKNLTRKSSNLQSEAVETPQELLPTNQTCETVWNAPQELHDYVQPKPRTQFADASATGSKFAKEATKSSQNHEYVQFKMDWHQNRNSTDEDTYQNLVRRSSETQYEVPTHVGREFCNLYENTKIKTTSPDNREPEEEPVYQNVV